MRYIKLIHIVAFCSGLFFVPLQAQQEEPEPVKRSADDIYKNYGYKASIAYYENKDVINADEMAKIANAYRLNHDTENSEFWYGQIVEKSTDPQHVFYYAQALQSNGRFDMAKSYYLKYDEMVGAESGSDQRGKLLADAIDRMNDFKHTEVQIKNEKLINTGKLDFSPAYYKQGIIFVSTRGAQHDKTENAIDSWINDNFMALFYAERNSRDDLENAREFSVDLTTKYHEGPVCFSKNGERIFFTRNDYIEGNRRNSSDGTMKLQIYSAGKEGETWGTPVVLPFNTVEHEEAHPALSPDGGKLYFASDRPGGFGGMDLYVSRFENGAWSSAENLGEKINTPGNEVFPFVHDDGTMYFASNGWGGLGGLDIFSVTPLEENSWGKVNNVGTPFNSKKDDFGFIMNVLKTEGYLTSARRNGNGQDDIYSFLMPKDAPTKVKICAYENDTDLRLEDVQFEIVEKLKDESTASLGSGMDVMSIEPTKEGNEYILKFKQRGFDVSEKDVVKIFNTNAGGEIETYLKESRDYLIIATKDGYMVGEQTFEGSKLKGKSLYEFCVPLDKMNCMNLDGVVKNRKYGNVIPGATVTMTNVCTGDDIVITADKEGYFKFPCIPCGCDYYFKGQKTNFRDGSSKQNTIGNNCKLGETINTEILLDNDMEELEAKFAGIKLEAGAVIELENIYYDFDQYYIRDDAKDELGHIVKLLKTYPGMTIELSSHTDARATHEYNETLSQNRANAAVDYIVSRGIQRSRLVPMGYGETKLRNRCANFVECTEEEHQNNRRTEVRVLKFDRKNIDVKHLDNKPETIDPADPKRKFRWN